MCKQCSKTIKAAGGSTSGLHNHLKSQHNINLLKREKENTDDNDTSKDIASSTTSSSTDIIDIQSFQTDDS